MNINSKKYGRIVLPEDIFQHTELVLGKDKEGKFIYHKRIRLQERYRKPFGLEGLNLMLIRWKTVLIGEDSTQDGIDFRGSTGASFNLIQEPVFNYNLRGSILEGCSFGIWQLPENISLRHTDIYNTDIISLSRQQAEKCIYASDCIKVHTKTHQ